MASVSQLYFDNSPTLQATTKMANTSDKKQVEYLGRIILKFNGMDAPIPFTGLAEVEGMGYQALLWFPRKDDSKLYVEGKLTYSGAGREEKIGFLSLQKASGDTAKYDFHGWLKFYDEVTDTFITSHRCYLYRVNDNPNYIDGYVIASEQTDAPVTKKTPSSALPF